MASAEPTLDTILTRWCLTRDDLVYKCSDEHMNELALKIDSWESLSYFIGLSKQDVENIKDEYHGKKHMDKKMAMLRRWCEKYGKEATYLKLTEEFDKLKKRDLIEELIKLVVAAKRDSTVAAPSSRDATSSTQLMSKGNPLTNLDLSRAQVGVQETTNRPETCSPHEDKDLIELSKSLEKHDLRFGSNDKKVLIAEGIICIETIDCYNREELDDLCSKVTPNCRKQLKTFWTRNQPNEGRLANDHDPMKEEEVVGGCPVQETAQPSSIDHKQIEFTPTQESGQQNDVGGNPLTSRPDNVPKDSPTPIKPSVPSDEDSKPDSQSDDENEDHDSDSGDEGLESDGFGNKASFKPHPRVFRDGKLTYEPKLKLEDESKTVKTFKTALIVQPSGRECYKMKSKEHGVALIINNKMFDNTQRHKKREGTDRDEENLVETFRFLGYRVKVRRQCKKEKIEKLFDKMSRWIKAVDDSFVCCILSHGDENIVYGSDSKDVPIRTEADSIEMKLTKCQDLMSKPKIFFISTCRGNKTGQGKKQPAEPDATRYVPDRTDFAFYYSTLPGEISWRDPQTGTFYINKLCHILCEKASSHLLSDMQKEVTEKVGQMSEKYQVPSAEENLPKNVFFFDDLV